MVNAKQIKGVLQICETKNTDEVNIDYPENGFVLCCESFTPIGRGKPSIRCPYCSSIYHEKYDQYLCSNCNIAKIGQEATGLKSSQEQ